MSTKEDFDALKKKHPAPPKPIGKDPEAAPMPFGYTEDDVYELMLDSTDPKVDSEASYGLWRVKMKPKVKEWQDLTKKWAAKQVEWNFDNAHNITIAALYDSMTKLLEKLAKLQNDEKEFGNVKNEYDGLLSTFKDKIKDLPNHPVWEVEADNYLKKVDPNDPAKKILHLLTNAKWGDFKSDFEKAAELRKKNPKKK